MFIFHPLDWIVLNYAVLRDTNQYLCIADPMLAKKIALKKVAEFDLS